MMRVMGEDIMRGKERHCDKCDEGGHNERERQYERVREGEVR